jgi:hypothetical protein
MIWSLEKYRGTWCALMLCLACAFACRAEQSVVLGWLPSPSSQVAGYHIYYGTASGAYTTKVNAGTNTSFTINGLTAGQTYYFSATAYNASGTESVYSPEISFITPGMLKLSQTFSNGVHTMRVQFPVGPSQQFTLQTSTNLISWTSLWVSPLETTNGWVAYNDPIVNKIGSRFYRLVIGPMPYGPIGKAPISTTTY